MFPRLCAGGRSGYAAHTDLFRRGSGDETESPRYSFLVGETGVPPLHQRWLVQAISRAQRSRTIKGRSKMVESSAGLPATALRCPWRVATLSGKIRRLTVGPPSRSCRDGTEFSPPGPPRTRVPDVRPFADSEERSGHGYLWVAISSISGSQNWSARWRTTPLRARQPVAAPTNIRGHWPQCMVVLEHPAAELNRL